MESDWLEDVFFHDTAEILNKKNDQLVALMRKNPSCAQADEAIDWFELLPRCKWPESTDDLRVHLRVNLVSQLDLLHSHIPWSSRMTMLRPFIFKAVESYFGGFEFKCIGRRFINLHHLHGVIAIAIFQTVINPIHTNPARKVAQPRELESKIEDERRYVSRLLQPEFYEDLQPEWSKRKRSVDQDDDDEDDTSNSSSGVDSREVSSAHTNVNPKETELSGDDSDAVFQPPDKIVEETTKPSVRKVIRFTI